MVRKRRLYYNTAWLTLSSLLMEFIAMAFEAWLVGHIGTAGVGLFQLTMSVVMLAMTVAVSGVHFAATRLASEEMGLERPGGVGCAMRACTRYALFFGFVSAAALFALAPSIGTHWISDTRAVRSLRICALGLPCVALSSALSGYFTASGRVWKSTVIHIIEQLTTVLLAMLFIGRVEPGDIEGACAAVCLGRTAGDIVCAFFMLLAYRNERRGGFVCADSTSYTPRLLRIALPLAVSAYVRSALSTAQHLLVPSGLRASGYSYQAALAGYGIIQGMALPILLFPACLTRSLAELIIPELTDAQMKRDKAGIRRTSNKLIYYNALFALAVSLALFVFAEKLSVAIYETAEAAQCIRLLAPLVPVMYTDTAVDGCLKGLGEQAWCMGVNIVDALIGLVMTWYLLPRYALTGYIVMIYVSECVNLALSAGRLVKVLKSVECRA